jgi:RNA polymerase sigma factor (sigma-70 family)
MSDIQAYIDEVFALPILSRAEELTLIPAAKCGDERALKKLIKAHLREVVAVARQYADGKIPLEDLISEGNLGLFRALKLFDIDKGCRFSTYARWWIRRAITYAIIMKYHTIRLPQNVLQKSRWDNEVRPNESGQQASNLGQVSIEKQLADVRSLFAQVNGDEGGMLLNLVADPSIPGPDEGFELTTIWSRMAAVLRKTLSERELEILKLKYGIGIDRRWTLADIGEKYGISGERVRQIKKRVLEKLRSSEVQVELRKLVGQFDESILSV